MYFYETVTTDEIQRGNKRIRESAPDFVWFTREDTLKLMSEAERRVVRMPAKVWPNGMESPEYDDHQILVKGEWVGFGETDLFDDVRHPAAEPPKYWDK